MWNSAYASDNFSVLRVDRTAEAVKIKGGGVCFMINRKWCDPRNISILSRSCSPHLENLSIICRPFYLPREFSSIIITSVYIPPQADTSLALSKLHDELSGYNNKHPDAAFIIAGDFNKANLKKVLPNFQSNQRTEYTRSLLHSAQKCLQSPLTAGFWQIRSCRHFPHTGIQTKDRSWTAGGEGSDALVLPLWSYATGISWWRRLGHVPGEFIWRQQIHGCSIKLHKHANRQATETVTIRTFSNQKPWVDRSIRDAVNHRTAAYNAGLLSGNMSEYKALCYALRRAIRAAKRRYREKIESHVQLNDSRRMWQGLKTICSSGNNSSAEVRADPLLAEDLNTFYGRFECNGGGATLPSSVRKQQTEQRWLCYHLVRGRCSEGTKESERQERTWWDYWPRSEVLCWSACWFVYIHL